MSPRRRAVELDPSAGVGLVVLALLVTAAPAAAAPSITPLSFGGVAGHATAVPANAWVTVESHHLSSGGGTVTDLLVNVTNLDDADVNGRIDVRLLTRDGRVVSAGNTTVYVQKKGKTARCSVGLGRSPSVTGFTILLVTVDTTADVSRQAAACVSRGQGGGPPGN